MSLATAHPAKFADAVGMALCGEDGFKFDDVMPKEFLGLEGRQRRFRDVGRVKVEAMRNIILEEIGKEVGDFEGN